MKNHKNINVQNSVLIFNSSKQNASNSVSYKIEPFIEIPEDSSQVMFNLQKIKAITQRDIANTTAGIPRQVSVIESSWLNLIFLLLFFVFSLIHLFTGKSVSGNFKNIFNLKQQRTRSAFRIITSSDLTTNIFLTFQCVLILSVIIFQILFEKNIITVSSNKFFPIFVIFGIIAVFIILRSLIYLMYSLTFFQREVQTWQDNYFNHIELLGILIFIPSYIFVMFPQYQIYMLILIAFIFIFVKVIFLASILNIFVKSRIGFLYFIVYLCAVEILPYFLLIGGVVSIVNHYSF